MKSSIQRTVAQTDQIRVKTSTGIANIHNFVLDKDIFSNIFEKDIRRVFIYKKAERLAKALQLIAPAFSGTPVLQQRISAITVGLIDAAVLSPVTLREKLSKEILTLSSIIAVAETGAIVSSMNAGLIAREANLLLQEIAIYQEPRLILEETPTLSGLAKEMPSGKRTGLEQAKAFPKRTPGAGYGKGRIKDISLGHSGRHDTILSILRTKGEVHIKDVSTLLREVSEKTIQRELQQMVDRGEVVRRGRRRWTTYSLSGTSQEIA